MRTFDSWQADVLKAYSLGESAAWVVGDLLNEGESLFGDDYAQVISESGINGINPQTAANRKSVAGYYPKELRRNLTFSHHAAAMGKGLAIDDSLALLDTALSQDWSRDKVADARRALQGIKNVESTPRTPVLRLKLADPADPLGMAWDVYAFIRDHDEEGILPDFIKELTRLGESDDVRQPQP